MAANGLSGSTKGRSKSAQFYHNNPESRNKKKEYDTKYHSTPSRRKYRSILNAVNREKGSVGDGMDAAHTSRKKTILQSQSKNRADKKRQFFK